MNQRPFIFPDPFSEYTKKGRYIKKRTEPSLDAQMSAILSEEIQQEIDRKLLDEMMAEARRSL